MLDSVQGVEGGLKFDPTTGGLVAASSLPQEFDTRKNLFLVENTPSLQSLDPLSAIKLEDDDCYTAGGLVIPKMYDIVNPNIVNLTSPNREVIAIDAGLKPAGYDIMPGSSPGKASLGSYQAKENKRSGHSRCSSKFGNSDYHHVSLSSGIEIGDGDDVLIEHNQPTTSSMTDSSNGSGSLLHGSSSSSQSFEEQKHPKGKTSCIDSISKIIVKATYREDTVRFKFDTFGGCLQLYEEVAQRFKLQTGTFQLKYLDDEEEWVMLVSDMDLQECLEILDDVGTRSVKFQVRDMPCAVGSSGSSNCFLAPGS